MRRIATPDEIFDILDDAQGRKFATIGYVTGANLNMPTVRKINPETNRMKNFDDYAALGKRLGYEDEIGGIVKLASYTIQLSNRKQIGMDYTKYKEGVNDIRGKYGLEPMKDKTGYTTTLNYGVNGISAYGGNDTEKQGHLYYPANTHGVIPRSTYYVLDKNGSIDREISKEELGDLLKPYTKSIGGESELRKMGAEEEKIKAYVEEIQNLGMAYKNFEYSSILYIVGSANGEKYIYINTNLSRAIGNVNVNPQEFGVIVKARYADDLADIPTDTTGEFANLNEEFGEEPEGEMRDVPFMSDKTDLERGITLMEEAIRQYKDGKYTLANHSRKEANKYFDSLEANLSDEEGIEKAMYGEGKNFGLIYNVIEENANHMYESEEGKKNIAKIVKFIKGDNILLNEFKIYNAFTNVKDVDDVETYVNESISVIKRHDRKDIAEANSMLVKLVKSLGLNENINITNGTMKLYEAIEYTLFNKPTISNVKEYCNVKKVIKENVERLNRKSANRINIDTIVDTNVSSLTEKYNQDLNEDEVSLLEQISNSPEKCFNEYKENLMNGLKMKIDEAEEMDKAGWQEIYEKVEKKTFDEKNVLSDIADMVSLRETIE